MSARPVSRRTALSLCASGFAAAALAASPVLAQGRKTPESAQAAEQSSVNFTSALQQLADEGRMVIVAEGVPLRGQVPSGEVGGGDGTGSVEDRLKAVAAAFDYDCVRSNAGVFVLTKRYSDPRDIPGVTPEELSAALGDVVRLLDPFDPKVGTGGDLARSIFAALTPEQIIQMARGDLQVHMLLPEQRAVMRKAVDYFSVGMKVVPLRDGAWFASLAATGALCHDTVSGQRMIGYRFRSPHNGEQVFRGIGPDKDDGHVPREPGINPSGYAARYNEAQSLKGMFDQLSRTGKVMFEVTPELEGKPVTVVTGKGTAVLPERVAAAAAEVYGLRLHRSGTRVVLRRPKPLLVRDQAELPAAVRALIPGPLRRALRIRQINPSEHLPPMPNAANYGRPGLPDGTRYSSTAIDENANLLRQEARRFLAVLLDDHLTRAARSSDPVEEIPVPKMERFARAALAGVLAYEPIASTSHFLTSPLESLPYVTEFNNLYISGEQFEKDGRANISFALGVRDPRTGRIIRYVGVTKAPAVDPARKTTGDRP